MNHLFNTPLQAVALVKKLPGLNSRFCHNLDTQEIDSVSYSSALLMSDTPRRLPALTLQELRNVAEYHTNWYQLGDFCEILWHKTAPELAEWVIARLEERP